MRTMIHENERGFLFHKGKYVKLLEPGTYWDLAGKKIEVVELEQDLGSAWASLEVLLRDGEIARQTAVVEVAEETLALHFVNGTFAGVLKPGKYAYWTVFDRHEFRMVSTAEPEVSADVPRYLFAKMPAQFYTKVEVAEYQKARLYYDRKFVKLLDAGTYYFWKGSRQVTVDFVDMRLLQMEISGQEVLTRDKVTVRINFVCRYRITDYVRVLTEIDDYGEQLHVTAQLALRDYVGRYCLDELLENKEQLGAFVLEHLREKAGELYVEIADAGVRDLILPGEIRDIMNTVLLAQKRAQANVITRREEVASTRSLLNTARLMEENQTLYKLKELEYLERICENVGNITVNGSSGILNQLAALMGNGAGKKEE